MNKDINKFKGCLIGGAIGDALGYPIEFVKPSKNDKISRFDGKGIISDDTQMTLFTANGLLWGQTRFNLRGIAPNVSDCIYLAYQDWYKTQSRNKNIETKISWITELPELNVERAPGMTCLNALSSNKKGTIETPINNSKGCGSVMRVAPIGLFFNKGNSLNEIGKYGAEAGAITHGHPLGIIPCYVLTIIINRLAYTNKSIEEAVNEAIDEFKINFDIFNKEDRDYFITLMRKAIGLAHKKFTTDENAIKELGEGWVAEEALAIAVYSSIKYSNDFKKAIICAVNHGGDSDSTGAITGNIIGTYLGINKIPSYYVDNLELSDVIQEIAEDLYTGCPVDEYSPNADEYWLSKYLYHQRDLSKRNKNMMLDKELTEDLKDNKVSNENITDNNSNDNIEALKVVSELLKLPLNDIKEYAHTIKNEPTLLYISIPVKGGESLIIDKNTLEFLYANSSVSFERHLQEYKKGTRNKKEDFVNYK